MNVLSLKGYLPLNEYSTKYRISLSTLRRRIRSGEIEYRFELGKYWLAEQPPAKYGQVAEAAAPQTETIFDSTQKVLQELKGAFVSVLHEKEEQITQLKEEVTDLKTLVQILEAENERLRSSEAAPIDTWIEENI